EHVRPVAELVAERVLAAVPLVIEIDLDDAPVRQRPQLQRAYDAVMVQIDPELELGKDEIRHGQLPVAIPSHVRPVEHRERPESVAELGRRLEREVTEQLA